VQNVVEQLYRFFENTLSLPLSLSLSFVVRRHRLAFASLLAACLLACLLACLPASIAACACYKRSGIGTRRKWTPYSSSTVEEIAGLEGEAEINICKKKEKRKERERGRGKGGGEGIRRNREK